MDGPLGGFQMFLQLKKLTLGQKFGGKQERVLCTLLSSFHFVFFKHSEIFFGENAFNKYLQRLFKWHSLDQAWAHSNKGTPTLALRISRGVRHEEKQWYLKGTLSCSTQGNQKHKGWICLLCGENNPFSTMTEIITLLTKM